MRIRITFAKTDAMRYTGHLDVYRAWERAFRRAGLPLAYSQGFHPQPRINLASALPLGFTSQGEVGDFWLETTLPISEVAAALGHAVPPGLQVIHVEEVDTHAPALQSLLHAAEYEVTLLESIPGLDQRLAETLAAASLPRQRRGKDYDLRPLIEEIRRLPDDAAGRARLHMRLAAREGATGRPEEVAAALGAEPEMVRVERLRLIFDES